MQAITLEDPLAAGNTKLTEITHNRTKMMQHRCLVMIRLAFSGSTTATTRCMAMNTMCVNEAKKENVIEAYNTSVIFPSKTVLPNRKAIPNSMHVIETNVSATFRLRRTTPKAELKCCLSLQVKISCILFAISPRNPAPLTKMPYIVPDEPMVKYQQMLHPRPLLSNVSKSEM